MINYLLKCVCPFCDDPESFLNLGNTRRHIHRKHEIILPPRIKSQQIRSSKPFTDENRRQFPNAIIKLACPCCTDSFTTKPSLKSHVELQRSSYDQTLSTDFGNDWTIGTKPSPKNDPAFLLDNLIPYTLTGHIHEREVSHQLGTKVNFIPHVASWFQGISLTVNVPLSKPMTSRDIKAAFQEFYQDEKLVHVLDQVEPHVRDNAGKHFVRIGGFGIHPEGRRAVIVTSLDNLLKGAATQAVQNLNLALGYDEYAGIPIE